jgi:hypothetical protein
VSRVLTNKILYRYLTSTFVVSKLPCGFSGDKAFFVLGGKIEPLEIDGAARSQVAIKPCAESQSRVTFLREALEDFRLSPGF